MNFERIGTSLNAAIAILTSVIFLLLPPASYGVVAYLNLVTSMEREVELRASAINRIISNVPQLWTFQTVRYHDILTRDPYHLEGGKLTIFDDKGNEVTSYGEAPAWPVIAREVPLFDAGTITGRLETRHSLRDLLLNVGLLLLLGAALAGAALITLRVVPLRALRKVNESLREREAELGFANTVLTAATEGSPDGILIVDQNGRIVSNNRRFLDMWGIPLSLVEAHIDAPVLRAVVSQVTNPDAFKARVNHLYDHPEESGQDRIELKHGRVFDRHTTALYRDKKYLGRIWFFRDMTERESLEKAIRASEQKFRNLVETTTDFIWEIDDRRQFVYASPATKAMFGYEPEELIGKSMFSFMSPGEAARFAAEITPYAAARRPLPMLEVTVLRKDGSEAVIEVSGVPVFDSAGTYVGYRGIDRDVTKRKLAEQALQRRDALLHVAALSAAELASTMSHGDATNNVLRRIGETIQVDRINVIEQPAKPGDLPVCQFSWKGPDVSFDLDIQLVAKDSVETMRWWGQLRQGEVVQVDVNTITGPTRETLDRLQVKTLLLVPVIINGAWWGHIAFDNCRTERRWELFEIELLRTLTELIGNSVRRERNVEALRDAMRIVQNTPTILYRASNVPAMVLSYISENVKLFGHDPEALTSLPDPLKTLVHPDDLPKVLEMLSAIIEGSNQSGVLEHRVLTGEGSYRWVENRYTAIHDASGRLVEIEGLMVDITERKAAQEKITLLARIDALTGLANRATFDERLRLAFTGARRGAPAFAVLYLDLDRFKDVNDTLGHPAGDLLLKIVAERLQNSTRQTDLVARPGGDEFAILQADLGDAADAGALAAKIRAELAVPVQIEGNELHITASVGIAIYTPEIATPDEMLTRADLALYRAKQEGRDQHRFHSEELDNQIRERVTVADELKTAIDRQEFELYYQPQVERLSGRIVGMEALLRWNHPMRGRLEPPDFIPVAEKTGSIAAIGRWFLDNACGQMSAWRKIGIAPSTITVNVSLAQLKIANEFLQTVTGTLAKWGLAGSDLEVAVTESVLAYITLANNDVLERLQKLGVKIAIDEFGMKFSSLDYLKSYSVSRIMIPKSMLRAENGAKVRAIAGIAREMKVGIVAQGVETEAQWASLTNMPPTANVRGYFSGKPMPANRAMELLRRGVIEASEALKAG